jgi:hypothetical protein
MHLPLVQAEKERSNLNIKGLLERLGAQFAVNINKM